MNFTRVQARAAILTEVLTKLEQLYIPTMTAGDLMVYSENSPKEDMDEYKYVVEVSIQFDETSQADISPNPTMRSSGVVSFVVGVREGGGTIVPLTIADFIHQNFRRLWLEKVRLANPRDVGPPYSLNHWVFNRIDVPFRFDAKNFEN